MNTRRHDRQHMNKKRDIQHNDIQHGDQVQCANGTAQFKNVNNC
jgi:hypothetical protein